MVGQGSKQRPVQLSRVAERANVLGDQGDVGKSEAQLDEVVVRLLEQGAERAFDFLELLAVQIEVDRLGLLTLVLVLQLDFVLATGLERVEPSGRTNCSLFSPRLLWLETRRAATGGERADLAATRRRLAARLEALGNEGEPLAAAVSGGVDAGRELVDFLFWRTLLLGFLLLAGTVVAALAYPVIAEGLEPRSAAPGALT